MATSLSDETRFPVIEPSRCPGFVEHSLHFQVASWAHQVGHERTKASQRLQDFFSLIKIPTVAADKSNRWIAIRAVNRTAAGMLSVGMDRMKRNFQPMKKQVEA